jgi:hypothetical protein
MIFVFPFDDQPECAALNKEVRRLLASSVHQGSDSVCTFAVTMPVDGLGSNPSVFKANGVYDFTDTDPARCYEERISSGDPKLAARLGLAAGTLRTLEDDDIRHFDRIHSKSSFSSFMEKCQLAQIDGRRGGVFMETSDVQDANNPCPFRWTESFIRYFKRQLVGPFMVFTVGTMFTCMHMDACGLGVLAFLPSFKRGVAKLWWVATGADRRTNDYLRSCRRFLLPENGLTEAQFYATELKIMLDAVKRGLLKVYVQTCGDVVYIPDGCSHAVITCTHPVWNPRGECVAMGAIFCSNPIQAIRRSLVETWSLNSEGELTGKGRKLRRLTAEDRSTIIACTDPQTVNEAVRSIESQKRRAKNNSHVSKTKQCKLNAAFAQGLAATLVAPRVGRFHATKFSSREPSEVRTLLQNLDAFLHKVCPNVNIMSLDNLQAMIIGCGQSISVYRFYRTKTPTPLEHSVIDENFLGFAIYQALPNDSSSAQLHIMGTIGNKERIGKGIIDWMRYRFQRRISIEAYEHSAKFFFYNGFTAADASIQRLLRHAAQENSRFLLPSGVVVPFEMNWHA